MSEERTARVGVVVPTYKRPLLLKDCLRSLEGQTFSDFAVYVCDNAADEETRNVVESFGDHRFRYIPRRENLGIFGNVIAAFRAVRNPLVIEVDDDDALMPDALAHLVAPFDRVPDLVMSFGDMRAVDEEGENPPAVHPDGEMLIHRSVTPGLMEDFRVAAARGYVFAPASLVHRDVLAVADFDSRMGSAYDRYIAIKASRMGRPAWYVPEPLVRYRVHPGTDTAMNQVKQWEAAEFVLETASIEAVEAEREALVEELVVLRLRQLVTLVKDGRLGQSLAVAGRLLGAGVWLPGAAWNLVLRHVRSCSSRGPRPHAGQQISCGTA